MEGKIDSATESNAARRTSYKNQRDLWYTDRGEGVDLAATDPAGCVGHHGLGSGKRSPRTILGDAAASGWVNDASHPGVGVGSQPRTCGSRTMGREADGCVANYLGHASACVP